MPNGMVQEFGAVYETARYLNIPAVTYEFGDPNRKVWLAHNNLVIHHNNDDLWFVHKDRKLNPEKRRALEELFAGRRGLNPGENFAHLWQKAEPEGGAKVRAALELDNRPVVLLPTNVLGDTATLGLTIFSKSMTEWLQRVILYLAEKPEIQVVVRIHPAETWTVGPSVAEIIDQVLPELPEHIRLIGSREKVNTYDLMEIADLVLVYTTSVGLEMATGESRWWSAGGLITETRDSPSMRIHGTSILQNLEAVLKDMHAFRLTPDQVEKAWNYAYIFFKEYHDPSPGMSKKSEKTWLGIFYHMYSALKGNPNLGEHSNSLLVRLWFDGSGPFNDGIQPGEGSVDTALPDFKTGPFGYSNPQELAQLNIRIVRA